MRPSVARLFSELDLKRDTLESQFAVWLGEPGRCEAKRLQEAARLCPPAFVYVVRADTNNGIAPPGSIVAVVGYTDEGSCIIRVMQPSTPVLEPLVGIDQVVAPECLQQITREEAEALSQSVAPGALLN